MFNSIWPWKDVELRYEKVNDIEDSASDEGTERGESVTRPRFNRSFPWKFWVGTLLNLVVFLTGIVLFTSSRITPNAAAKVLSQPSAYLDWVTLKIKDVTVNGTLFPPDQPYFSRAEPGDAEAEAMWQRFEPSGFFPITRNDLLKLGKDPEVSVKFPDEVFGFGEEAYVASFDTLHKIHCLNELRKSTFGNYPGMQQYFSGSDHDLAYRNQSHSKMWWIHLRHCVDLVAQDLMCHADSDLVTYTWRDMQAAPYPDMSINKKCRDLDQLVDYSDQHKVDIGLYTKTQVYHPGLDTKLLPHEKKWYLQSGFEDSILFPDGKGFDEYWESHDS